MIPLFKVYMSEKAPEEVSKVLTSGYIGEGPKVVEFENALKDRFQNDLVASTNSATNAEHLALHLLKKPDLENNWPGILEGEEVLATPLTCTATNWPILANGLRIKWVDIDPETLNMDLDDLERKITSTTKAIMIVHWGGYPNDLDRLKEIQDKSEKLYGFRPAIIEDSAHAFGSLYKGKPIGSHGNICTFSFQAIKHLTAVDGGALVLPNETLYKRAKLIRWFGIDRETNKKDFRCLHPSTRIMLADGGTSKILDLVKSRSTVEVLSEQDGKLVPKKITGWHTNPRAGRKLVKISTESLKGWKSATVTEDHRILTRSGYKMVSELKEGELVATSIVAPSKDQEKLLIASLLGDGCFTTKTKSNRAVFNEGHSSRQEEYLMFKYEYLKSLGCKIKRSEPNVRHRSPYGKTYIYTPSLPSLGDLRKMMYPKGGIKRIPKVWLENNFDAFVMAVWFMDDGCTYVANTHSGLAYDSEIATNGFTENDVKFLAKFLSAKGFECRIKAHKGSSGYRIFFTRAGSRNLLEFIAPYVPPCMAYKIGHNPSWTSLYNEDNWVSESASVFYDKLTIEDYKGAACQTVYCLEVEGTQNFATSSLVAHNCEADVKEWGFKFHMNDVNATVGLTNLKEVDENVLDKHRANAKFYDEQLKDVPGVTLLRRDSFADPSYWIYTILVDRRQDFMDHMKECGIMVSQVHERNDIHSCAKEFKSLLPNLDRTIKRVIAIPAGWWVSAEERQYIVDCIKKGW